jgi:arginine/lysine/histidine transporter system substrate-binding protein
MKKIISLLMMSILIAGVLAACGSNEKDAGNGEESNNKDAKVLKMGTSADYPPFEYIDTAKGSDIIGIDAEIAKAVTEKLGYELEIQDMDFGGLISALQNGQIDFAASAMSATDERKESVDFSDIYYTSKHIIVSKKGSGIQSVDDLKGKTIGAQLGSIQETKANELAETTDFKVDSRNRIPELIQEIMAGRMDAAIIEDTVAEGYLRENKDIEGFTIEDADGGYAIAFPKGSELTEEFNKTLKAMIDSGEIDTIIKKYFDAE